MTGRASSGLSAVVRRGDLRHRAGGVVRRFATTLFDDELLAAIDAAARAGVPLALVIPLPADDIPVVLGAACLISEIVRAARLDVTATVVSRRLSQRAGYDRLYVRDQRLVDTLPRARLTPAGRLELIGSPCHDGGGRMVLTPDPVRAAGRPGGLVIDATGTDVGDLRPVLSRGHTLIYLTDNPFDSALESIRDAGGVVWAFDPAALTRLATSSDVSRSDGVDALSAPAELLATAAGAQRLVWAPETDTALDHALHAAWTALGRLTGTVRGPDAFAAAHALRWAWGVFATYSLLATSPARYDAHLPPGPYATRLGEAASHARAVARSTTGGGRDVWGMLGDAFAELHAAAGSAPKFDLIAGWLTQVADGVQRGLLVTRNRSAAAALIEALAESARTPHGWEAQVQVVAVRDVVFGRVKQLPCDVLAVTGPLPRAYASLAAVPPATHQLTLAAGGWEADRAARQLTGTLRALTELRTETVTRSAARLAVPAIAAGASDPATIVSVWRHGSVTSSADLPEPAEPSPWEPFRHDLLATIGASRRGNDEAPDLPPPARGGVGTASARVIALTVTFTDARCLLIEPNDLLYRRRGTGARRVAAKALVPGDIVALVDSAARRDLFDAVIDTLAELPKYAPLTALIRFWHARAARAGRRMTYGQILAGMRRGDPRERTSITSEATIGTWVRGDIAGPADPEDVRRFAIAVGDRELRRDAEKVATALAVNRRVHIAVGLWLSAQFTGAKLRSDDTLVDAELGVHVADLLEAVSLHEVATVDTLGAPVPAALVGTLLDADAVRRALVPGQPMGQKGTMTV